MTGKQSNRDSVSQSRLVEPLFPVSADPLPWLIRNLREKQAGSGPITDRRTGEEELDAPKSTDEGGNDPS